MNPLSGRVLPLPPLHADNQPWTSPSVPRLSSHSRHPHVWHTYTTPIACRNTRKYQRPRSSIDLDDTPTHLHLCTNSFSCINLNAQRLDATCSRNQTKFKGARNGPLSFTKRTNCRIRGNIRENTRLRSLFSRHEERLRNVLCFNRINFHSDSRTRDLFRVPTLKRF